MYVQDVEDETMQENIRNIKTNKISNAIAALYASCKRLTEQRLKIENNTRARADME